jgi:hypothetical protein
MKFVILARMGKIDRTEDICTCPISTCNMKKSALSFIILVGILFGGIVIMIKPTIFVSQLMPSQMAPPEQPLAGRIVPSEIIILGSVLTIIGLVGLSVLGFRIFEESRHEETKTY